MTQLIPENPLVRLNHIYRTYHVNLRLKQRFISREVIINSVDCYELIESYPLDKYLPSYLIYSIWQKQIFHIIFAVDIKEQNVRVITAYTPDPKKWEENLKKRLS